MTPRAGDRSPREITAFKLALAATLAEILLVMLWTLRMVPADAPVYAGILWGAIKSAPLALVVPGLLRGDARAPVWLCFLLCAYFLTALTGALEPPPRRWIGVVELALVCGGFVAGLLAARWARRPAAVP